MFTSSIARPGNIIPGIPDDVIESTESVSFLDTENIAMFKRTHKQANEKVEYPGVAGKYSKALAKYSQEQKALKNSSKAFQDRSITFIGELVYSINSKIEKESNKLFIKIITQLNTILSKIFSSYQIEFEAQNRLRTSIQTQQAQLNVAHSEILEARREFEKHKGEKLIMDIFGGKEAFEAIPLLSAEVTQRLFDHSARVVSKIVRQMLGMVTSHLPAEVTQCLFDHNEEISQRLREILRPFTSHLPADLFGHDGLRAVPGEYECRAARGYLENDAQFVFVQSYFMKRDGLLIMKECLLTQQMPNSGDWYYSGDLLQELPTQAIVKNGKPVIFTDNSPTVADRFKYLKELVTGMAMIDSYPENLLPNG